MFGRSFVDTRQAEDVLVGDVINQFIAAMLGNGPVKKRVKMGQQGRDRSEFYRLRKVGKALGKYSVANLTPEVLEGWMAARLMEVKPATVEREINQLHGVFAHAIKAWKMPFKNPCQGVERPKFRNRRDRILSDEMMALLLHELGSKHGNRSQLLVPFTQLALETAMRRGELQGLLWENVDLKRRVALLPTTKNGDPREVPLSTKAVAILEAIPRTSKLVFPDINYENFHGVWKRACERAGVTNFRFHDLRHMAITRIATKVPNIIELSRVSGHRNLRNLERYYHTTPEELAVKLG
jgi:integrase